MEEYEKLDIKSNFVKYFKIKISTIENLKINEKNYKYNNIIFKLLYLIFFFFIILQLIH